MNFTSQAVRTTSKSFQYNAPEHRYTLHTKGPHGTRASLQVKKELFVQFVRRVGVCNTVSLPHLHVMHQGFGWFTVTVLDEAYAYMVTKFLARFNKWMAKRLDTAPKPLTVAVCNSMYLKYAVEAPVHVHGPRPVVTRPDAPSAGALALLAHRFSKQQRGGRHA